MTGPRLPQLGSVIWAELEDANGFSKVRPAVVVTPTAEIAIAGSVRVLAITTRLPDPLPADHLLLPWHRDGKTRSGLRRKCAAVTSWQAPVRVDGVREVVGILPPNVIDDLLTKIAAYMQPSPAGEGSKPPESGES